MESTLLEIGKQVPALTVLAGVVWLFLKAGSFLLSANAINVKELQASYLASLREIQIQNLEARAQSRDAITDNTSVMREVNRTLVEILTVVKGKS